MPLVHLFALYMVVFDIFLFLLVSEVGCGLRFWLSLDFSVNCFVFLLLGAFGRLNFVVALRGHMARWSQKRAV